MEGRQSVILRFSTVQTVGASNATLSRVNYNLLHQGQPDCASAFPGELCNSTSIQAVPQRCRRSGHGVGPGHPFFRCPVSRSGGRLGTEPPPVTSFSLHNLARGAL